MNEYQTVCKVHDVPEGESKVVSLGKKVVGVYRQGGQWFAIDDVCPHMGASLSSGYIEDGIVTCPWHAWRFRLKDGVWADNPKLRVGCYEVRVEGDDVKLAVPTEPEKK